MSWLNVNINESLSNIKGQLTNLASNVLAEPSEDDSGIGRERIEELQKLITEQENEIKKLQVENSEISKRIATNNAGADWTWDLPETKSDHSNIADDVTLEVKIRDLEREKEELLQSLDQLDQDCQSTTDKLVSIKDELQTENMGLRLQHQDLIKQNNHLMLNLEQEHKRITTLQYEKETNTAEIEQLRNQLDQYQRISIDDMLLLGDVQEARSSTVSVVEYNRLETMVADYNKQIQIYEIELAKLRDSRSEEISRLSGASSIYAAPQKYFDLLLEGLKKIDDNVDRWAEGDHDNSQDYVSLIESIVKTVSDWKWKGDSLEEELKNARAEKTLLLVEKNNEIESLLQNMQQVTKELGAKNKEIRHYEEECAELSQNNEALINKFEETKQADMKLHTIPEMNELYDGQLEKCYKRIEHLERELEMKSSEQVEELKCQVILKCKDLELSQARIEELKCLYNKVEEENNSLKVYLDNIRKRFKECTSEKEELEDRLKLDSESIAEQSLNLETLQEEVEILTATILELRKDNSKYTMKKEDYERKLEEAEKEIMDLKEEMTTQIETSLKKDEQMTDFHNTVDCMEQNIRKLKIQVELLSNENEELIVARSKYIANYRSVKNDVRKLIACYKELKDSHHKTNVNIQEVTNEKKVLIDRLCKLEDIAVEKDTLDERYSHLKTKIHQLEKENTRLKFENSSLTSQKDSFEVQLGELHGSRNEIIHLVQQKHHENITYHAEIQRLQQLLSIESEKCKTFETQLAELNGTGITSEDLLVKEKEIEKLHEQNGFLREKCALLAENLIQEQGQSQQLLTQKTVATERELNMQRQLDSLRQHLIEVEDMYTKEIQSAETKCTDIQQKMQAVVEKEKNSSNRYTSANIRANQQVETLQTNLQLVTNQRDELKRKMSDLEDQMEKQNAALCNLQIVLEQFQREKDKVIYDETERIRRQVVHEKQAQNTLQQQINDLKVQLNDSKEGLKAAVRLSDQVETSKRQVTEMKDEVSKLQQQLNKSESKYEKLLNQTDGRVDKMLIKNLVIGLITCNNNLNKDQNQILKIISTVLDFNQNDIEKVHLNKRDQSTWFSGLLQPQLLADQSLATDSLSQAFVKFLEAESKPRNLPNLLDAASATVSSKSSESHTESASSSRKTSMRQSPLLLNEVVLPTFADFAANRNSSSILKDVLKDNSHVS